MDAGLVAAVLMLIVWAVGTFMWTAPGWFHGLLTMGIFLLIMRLVALGTKGVTIGNKAAKPDTKKKSGR